MRNVLIRIAFRVAGYLFEPLKDAAPHVKRAQFDDKVSTIRDDSLKRMLNEMLFSHDKFKSWLGNVAGSLYLSGSDQRKGVTYQSGMISSMHDAFKQAKSAYPDIGWDDLEDAVNKLTLYEVGRVGNKDEFVNKWDRWLYGFYEILSVILNRIEKSGDRKDKTSSTLTSIAARIAARTC